MTYRLLIAAQITPILHRERLSTSSMPIPVCILYIYIYIYPSLSPFPWPTSLAFHPLCLRRCGTRSLYISISIYADFRLGVVDYRSRGTSTSERSKIDSTMPGVRLIGDTYAPITTRKLWSNGNLVKSVWNSTRVACRKRKRNLAKDGISTGSISLAIIIAVKKNVEEK